MNENEIPIVRSVGRPRQPKVPPTDAVKEVRTKLGVTQEELAHEIGCSLAAVRVMERNRRLPGSHALRANFLKVAKRAGIEVPE